MSRILFQGDDALRLTSFNSAAGVTLSVDARMLMPGDELKALRFLHTPNTDRSSASAFYPMPPGELLSVQVRAVAGTPRRGQCLAILEIARGQQTQQDSFATLLQGYVTDTQRRAWPGSILEQSTDGRGVIRSITGTNPAAGAEISEAVPTNARWRVLSLQATLVTDANAANRDVALTLDDGTTVFHRSPAGQNHAAATTRRYVWSPLAQRFTIAQDGTMTMPIPDLFLTDGYRLRTVTTNIQVGDDWAAPQLLVEEWIED